MGRLTLPSSGKFYLDTSPVIYSVEQVAPYDVLMPPVWQSATNDDIALVSSELLLLEALVKPIKTGDEDLEERYRELLTNSTSVELHPIELTTLEKAVRIRASFGLKTPDAIHAATALEHSCELLITNDPIFKRVSGLTIIVLDEYI